jgi:hypothetical protein
MPLIIKYIHLTLEMNVLPRTMHVSLSREPNPHQSRSPTDSLRRHHRKEEDPHLHTGNTTRTKLERLRLARLIHRDPQVTKLDM